MLLRSISKHVKDQNWFAVALDFLIVVVGILIAFQITNWNEAREANTREQAVLAQLEEEFTEIRSAVVAQNDIREGYVEAIGALIATLEGSGPVADDLTIREALDAARAVGRRPAQSAAYSQLMTSGELATLSNGKLQKALVQYDNRLKREAFIFPELMGLVADELSTNTFVDFNVSGIQNSGAAIDRLEGSNETNERTRSYDLEGLKSLENRYEAMFLMNRALLTTDKRQLELVDEILEEISETRQK